jgi:hypothetical protein
VLELRQAAAALKRHTPPPPKRRHRLTKKRIAIILAVDLVVGSVAWHYFTEPHPSAVAKAVETVGSDAAHNNWSAVYGELCSSDRAQIAEGDIATAGEGALLELGGLHQVTVTHVTTTHVSLGPIPIPAAVVSGQLIPRIGAPSAYSVTAVLEASGWHVCLSAGGYSSAALGINVPLGHGQGPAV